jgi:hypothetical protein
MRTAGADYEGHAKIRRQLELSGHDFSTLTVCANLRWLIGDDTMAACAATARTIDNILATRRTAVEPKPIRR